MNNFYQSKLWQDINQSVFQRPIFEINFNNRKYFGIIKEKKYLLLNLRWFQVLGIELGNDWFTNIPQIQQEISIIKRDFNKNFGDIFFQFGIITPFALFKSYMTKESNFCNFIKCERGNIEQFISLYFGLIKTCKENMPYATVQIELQEKKGLLESMSKSARNHINKATHKGLKFSLAQDEDWIQFYDIWHQTSYDKGFSIHTKDIFHNLKNFLLTTKQGNLFITKQDNEIVSGSICLFDQDNIIYLYGATNRNYGNVGAHHKLKYELMNRGFQNGYKYTDLLGVSPTGYPDHHLKGVTTFKESLGGIKIESLGNYDLIFNDKLYNMFKMRNKH